MKHLAAYLLLQLGGNASPSAEDIKGVLSAVGIEAEDERLTQLLSELEGKDINEVRDRHTRNAPGKICTNIPFQLISEGSTKLASVPSGGAGGAAAPAAGAAAGGAAAEEAPAAAKEEEKEESDEDMGFGLFD